MIKQIRSQLYWKAMRAWMRTDKDWLGVLCNILRYRPSKRVRAAGNAWGERALKELVEQGHVSLHEPSDVIAAQEAQETSEGTITIDEPFDELELDR